MKKKFIYIIILTIMLFFLGMNNVYAKDCDKIDVMITKYESYNDELKTINCSDNSNEENVRKCDTYNMNKNLIVINLMRLRDQDNICSNQVSQVDQIIEENEDTCHVVKNDELNSLVSIIMKIFYIIGPILLILFGTLDYTKATVSSEKDALKKANQRFLKRLGATIILFLSPALTTLIIGLLNDNSSLSGNSYACDYKYIHYVKQYEIVYSSPTTYGGGGGGGTYAGNNYVGTNGILSWPLPKTCSSISSTYGNRARPVAGASTDHRAIDIGCAQGSDVTASADGTVTKSVNSGYNGGRGYYVIITHNIDGKVFATLYQHLSKPLVSEGQTVTAGQIIAKSGGQPGTAGAGATSGPHLHFEVHPGGYVGWHANEDNPCIYLGLSRCSGDVSSDLK